MVDHLSRRFEEAGHSVDIVRVHTHPTAALARRSERLLEAMRNAPDDAAHIHLIGHSSGGLDARILLSPRPGGGLDAGPLTARVKTLLTVATPHHGTPLAAYFSTRFGAQGLWLLSVITLLALRVERTPPIRLMVKLGSMITRADDIVGGDNSIVDQVFRDLLDDFSAERKDAVARLFEEVRADQDLLHELAPERMADFDPPLRDDVRAGSIVTRARRPSLSGKVEAGLNPYAQAMSALYSVLHQRTGKGFDDRFVNHDHHVSLVAVHGEEPPPDANDGIVPTWSQPFGEILAAPYADHLDVIGHFKDRDHDPPHIDWLATGSGFTRGRFEETWDHAVEWILRG